jgi:membrane-associated phospholipid phosphatase
MNIPQKHPSVAPVAKYPLGYIISFVLAVVVLLPALLIARKHQLTGIQARIFYDFNNISDVFKIPALILTEALGAAYPIIVCILVPLAYKRYKLAWRFFVAVGATGVTMEVVKKIAEEPRPAALLHGHLHQRALETGLNSFPSGHVAIATAIALTLWLILPKAWRWISVAWIVLIAVSRIYLGVHTLNDVVGGFVIGLAVVSAIRLLPPQIAKKLHLESDDTLLERRF